MKIINFGSCNIDFVYDVDHIVVPGETEQSNSLEIFSGGKGLNQSIAVSKAGVPVFHAGCVGFDGEMLLSVLKESGVNVSLIKRVQEKTGHAIIQLSKDGQNSIILYRGANGLLDQDYIDGVLSDFERGDVLLLQNETNNVEYVIDKAFEKGVNIIFNPAPFTDNLKNLDYGKIDYLIVNEIEAQGIGGKPTPEENIEELSDNFKNLNVVLTMGVKGALYTDNCQIKYQPAMKVDAVDTTAAGDTFIGYFVAEITKGESIVKAVKTAVVASALAVTKKGAAVSIPVKEEVISAQKNLKPYDLETHKNQIMRTKINCYLQENINCATLSGAANLLGYSNGHTGALITKLFGVSFTALLQDKRLSLAEKLLTGTELSVTEVIYNAGYENESFFRKIFKNKYGKTPYQYKKMKKGEYNGRV